MALLTTGYWATTYWPSSYWADDYWPEFVGGSVYNIAGIIAATSGCDGVLKVGNRASGINEPVVNEFRFPHIPHNLPSEVESLMNELRQALESQFQGDFYVGGDIHVDGDLHLGGSQV